MMTEYGARMERGMVTETTDSGARLRSLDRPGIITPILGFTGYPPAVGDVVWFYMTDDGAGMIARDDAEIKALNEIAKEKARAVSAENAIMMSVTSEKNRAMASESSISASILTKAHGNVNGVSGITAYPTDVGNYRMTGQQVSGIPGDCMYGELHIHGQGYYTHIYQDVYNRLWVGYTANSVSIPTDWKRILRDDGISSGTYSNDNATVYATWQKIGRVVTMSINLTPKANISTSTGEIKITDAPASMRPFSANFFSAASASARTRSAEVSSNSIWGFGSFTSGTAYFATFSYLSAN